MPGEDKKLVLDECHIQDVKDHNCTSSATTRRRKRAREEEKVETVEVCTYDTHINISMDE